MTKKQIFISIIAGAIILFVWNVISWMLLPFHSWALNTLPEEVINSETLKKELSNDGVYHYPGLPKDNTLSALKEVEKKLNSGPRITLMVYKAGGTELFSVSSFLITFLLNIITSLLLILLLGKLQNKNIKNVLITSVLTGLIICFARDLPQMIWYMFPLNYTLVLMMDAVIGFALLGLFFSLYSFKNRNKTLKTQV